MMGSRQMFNLDTLNHVARTCTAYDSYRELIEACEAGHVPSLRAFTRVASGPSIGKTAGSVEESLLIAALTVDGCTVYTG